MSYDKILVSDTRSIRLQRNDAHCLIFSIFFNENIFHRLFSVRMFTSVFSNLDECHSAENQVDTCQQMILLMSLIDDSNNRQ